MHFQVAEREEGTRLRKLITTALSGKQGVSSTLTLEAIRERLGEQ